MTQRKRTRSLFATITATAVMMSLLVGPAGAITDGEPDGNAHPMVGQLLFHIPDAIDPRFDDPGAWFTCSGTLIGATLVLTAGHCTFAVGLDGAPTTESEPAGDGGNDVWVNFQEEPDFSILPPSSTFVPDRNEERYDAWETALETDPNWIRGTAHPHPDYTDDAFFLFDLGVVELEQGVSLQEYGELPQLNQSDALKPRRSTTFTAVGYGLQRINPAQFEPGDTRMFAEPHLIQINTPGFTGDFSLLLSNNHSTGGTCFGDSGGPNFYGDTLVIAGVTSFGLNGTCGGTGGVYRVDRADDLNWLDAEFGDLIGS